MKLNVGDVYWLTVTYPKTSEVETRPVVIYDFENGSPVIASFATITGAEIKDFEGKYDKWKSPIFQWKNAGLDKNYMLKQITLQLLMQMFLIKKIILDN